LTAGRSTAVKTHGAPKVGLPERLLYDGERDAVHRVLTGEPLGLESGPAVFIMESAIVAQRSDGQVQRCIELLCKSEVLVERHLIALRELACRQQLLKGIFVTV
jgi:hypothetical protein